MGAFYPVYARRSDGKMEITPKGKSKERNEPTAEQLDQSPNSKGISDYYRLVKPTDMKSLDWRRKLGGMLARELGQSSSGGRRTLFTVKVAMGLTVDEDAGYMLAVFPENYRLYEHVKKTEKEGQTELKSKTHAAGGNDRQDAYLYGHPLGRKKRFRSPADFFPHLLWLCTDESGDPDNCTCKICSPEDLEKELPASARAKVEKLVKPEPTAKPISKPTTPTAQSGQQSQPVKQETSQVASRLRTPAAEGTTPTPLPAPISEDQKIDRQYNSFMYRTGEVVWFQRGNVWGLGVILRRWMTAPSEHHYAVQPLTDPFSHQAAQVKSRNSDMRPWLAWSVPPFTNQGLNSMMQVVSFDDADWAAIVGKRYGSGNLEQDGPILAAKTIDSTYTLFGLSKTVETEPGVTLKTYSGMFLGAEKIWVGDPIRLNGRSSTDVAVVVSVFERIQRSAMGQQVIHQETFILADHYTLATVNHTNPNVTTPAASSNNPHLPHRLTQDLAFRNERSIRVSQTASYMSLIAPQRRLSLGDIKGRWYEASLLLPILQPGALDKPAQKGEVLETGLWMNNRGDCQNASRPPQLPPLPKPNVRKDTRRAALGKAVPPDAKIEDDTEPPTASRPQNINQSTGGGLGSSSSQAIPLDMDMEIDPRFETAEDSTNRQGRQGGTSSAFGGSDGLDEFMNLDSAGDSQSVSQPLPGFGQEYSSHGQSGNSYY
ncbi:hypothetical protein MBLNU230_g1768t1 [Neophaeotheca triangularis]